MLMIKLGNRVVAKRREFVEKSHRVQVVCFGTGDWKGESWNLSADHHAPSNAQRLEHARNWFAQFGARHADQLRAGSRRVQERAEKIEDGPLAAFGAQLARRRNVFESGMIFRREEKGELMLAQRTRGLVRRPIDFHAERFEHVRAAGLRCDGPVAMFGHGDSGRGDDNCHCGRNVECAEPVAAGAADVEDFARARFRVERRVNGPGAQIPGKGGDFADGFSFAREGGEEIGFARHRNLFANEVAHGECDLLVGQRMAAGELFNQSFQHCVRIAEAG